MGPWTVVAAFVVIGVALMLAGWAGCVIWYRNREGEALTGSLLQELPAEYGSPLLKSLADHDLGLGGAQTELFDTVAWPSRRHAEQTEHFIELDEKIAETSQLKMLRALLAAEDYRAGIDREAFLAMERIYSMLSLADIDISLAGIGGDALA